MFVVLLNKDKGLDELAIADFKRAVDLGDPVEVSLSKCSLKEFYNIDYEKKER